MCVIALLITRWRIFLNIHKRGNNHGGSCWSSLLRTMTWTSWYFVGKRTEKLLQLCEFSRLASAGGGDIHVALGVKNGINRNMRRCSFPVGRGEGGLVTWLLLILEWQSDWRVLVFCWALSKNWPHNMCLCATWYKNMLVLLKASDWRVQSYL